MARGEGMEGDDVLIVGVEENDPECFCVGVTTGKATRKRHGRNSEGETVACTLGVKRRARNSLFTADVPIVLDGDETACELLSVVAGSSAGLRARDCSAKPGGESTGGKPRVDAVVEEIEIDLASLPEKARVSPCVAKSSSSDTQTSTGTDVSDKQGLPCERDGPTAVPTSHPTVNQTVPLSPLSSLSLALSSSQMEEAAASESSGGESGTDLQPLLSASGPTGLPRDYIESDYQMALQLSADSNMADAPPDAVSQLDAELARSLQAEEYRLAEGSLSLTGVEPAEKKKKGDNHNPSRAQSGIQSNNLPPQCPALGSGASPPAESNSPATSQLGSSPSSTGPDPSPSDKETLTHAETETDTGTHADTSTAPPPPPRPLHTYPQPPTWTPCPNCPPGLQRRYHLIAVTMFSDEWKRVSWPLSEAGYIVTSMERIQNETLWHRLQSECQLMLRGRHEGYDLNERLLYHTSRADKSVICEEGLDQRLSRCGHFGNGIYFR